MAVVSPEQIYNSYCRMEKKKKVCLYWTFCTLVVRFVLLRKSDFHVSSCLLLLLSLFYWPQMSSGFGRGGLGRDDFSRWAKTMKRHVRKEGKVITALAVGGSGLVWSGGRIVEVQVGDRTEVVPP